MSTPGAEHMNLLLNLQECLQMLQHSHMHSSDFATSKNSTDRSHTGALPASSADRTVKQSEPPQQEYTKPGPHTLAPSEIRLHWVLSMYWRLARCREAVEGVDSMLRPAAVASAAFNAAAVKMSTRRVGACALQLHNAAQHQEAHVHC